MILEFTAQAYDCLLFSLTVFTCFFPSLKNFDFSNTFLDSLTRIGEGSLIISAALFLYLTPFAEELLFRILRVNLEANFCLNGLFYLSE